MGRNGLTAIVFGLIALAAPAAAQASNYCVGAPAGASCSFGYPATAAGLQAALDGAEANADIGGTSDSVLIGPGTFTAVDGFKSGDSDVRIVGSGESTVLTRSGGSFNQTLLGPKGVVGSPAGFSVTDLRLDVVGQMSAAISGFKNVSDVHIAGPGIPYIGVDLPSGGRLSRATIEPAGFVQATEAVRLDAATVEDTLIRLRHFGTSPGYIFGVAAGSTVTNTTSTIRHVTVIGDGSVNSVGVLAAASGSQTNAITSIVHVRDTVLRGVDVSYARDGNDPYTVGMPPTSYKAGTVKLDLRYSSFAAGRTTSNGPGTTTLLAGNLDDPDPLFDATGRLTAGSPLIDAGDPEAPLAGDSTTDLGGGARIFGPRRDIGAFEYVPGPPGSEPAPVPTPGPPSGPTPGPAPGLDVRAPLISALRLSATRFRVGPAPTALSAARRRAAPAGTKITFTLSEPATVRLAFARRVSGRLVRTKNGKARACVRQTKRNTAGNRRCVRYVGAGALTRKRKAGRASVAFSGRIGRTRLASGAYRVAVVATDAAKNRSLAKTASFSIVTR
jgi:hypothetical protein